MLKLNENNNCVTEWHPSNWSRPLRISGWGCEMGNGFGFFSQEAIGGYGCQIMGRNLPPASPQLIESAWQIKFPKARIDIKMVDKIASPTSIIRHISVINPNSRYVSWLFDSVLRLAVPWEDGLVARLEQRDIIHRNSNFYYETEEPQVALQWTDGRRLSVKWLKKPNVPLAMTPYLYVRDQPAMPKYSQPSYATPSWVIHARTLVDYAPAFVFRLWRNPLVMWSRGLFGRYLISARYLKYFWRGGELHPGLKWFIFGLWPFLPKQSFNFSIMVEAN
jgi:hypothetical protein